MRDPENTEKKVPKGEKERKSKTAWKLTEAHLTYLEYLD